MDINLLDNRMVLIIVAALLTAAGWFVRWLVQKALNAQFDKIAAANLEEKKEREFDQYLSGWIGLSKDGTDDAALQFIDRCPTFSSPVGFRSQKG